MLPARTAMHCYRACFKLCANAVATRPLLFDTKDSVCLFHNKKFIPAAALPSGFFDNMVDGQQQRDGPAEQTIQLAQQRSSAGLTLISELTFIPAAALPSGFFDNMVDGQQQRDEAVAGFHDGGA